MGMLSNLYYATLEAIVTLDIEKAQEAGLSDTGAGCKWEFECDNGKGVCILRPGVENNPNTRFENGKLVSTVQVQCDSNDTYIAYFGATDGAMPVYTSCEFVPKAENDDDEIEGDWPPPDPSIKDTGIHVSDTTAVIYAEGDIFQGLQLVVMCDNTGSMNNVIKKSVSFVSSILTEYMKICPSERLDYCILGYGQGNTAARCYNKYNPKSKVNPDKYTWNTKGTVEGSYVPDIITQWQANKVQGGGWGWGSTHKGTLFPGNVKSYESNYKEPYKYEHGRLPLLPPSGTYSVTNLPKGDDENGPATSLLGRYIRCHYNIQDKEGRPYYVLSGHPIYTDNNNKVWTKDSNKSSCSYTYGWILSPGKYSKSTLYMYPDKSSKKNNVRMEEQIANDSPRLTDMSGNMALLKSIANSYGDNANENAVGTIWEACVHLKWDPRMLHVIINLGDEPPYEYGWACRYYTQYRRSNGTLVDTVKRVSMLEAVDMMNERNIHMVYISTGSVKSDRNFWAGKAMECMSTTTSKGFSMEDDKIGDIVDHLKVISKEMKEVKYTCEPVDKYYDLATYSNLKRAIKCIKINDTIVWTYTGIATYVAMKPNKTNIIKMEMFSTEELHTMGIDLLDGEYQIGTIIKDRFGQGFQGANAEAGYKLHVFHVQVTHVTT